MAPTATPSVRVSMLALITLLAPAAHAADFDDPPAWARQAVWYQIMVERFRNGDPHNDPTPQSLQGADPGLVPDEWTVTPWAQDWYRPDPWALSLDLPFHAWVGLRRYGGDLQGVLDKLDYLQDLGVTALYFNPLFDAPSLHKYDAATYHHIDRHFGPDPRGDADIMAAENPLDVATWQWTAADRLFLELVTEVHRRGMRLLIDVSWNHTGTTFWAWKDLVRRQEKSPFRDWYEVEAWDDPSTPANEFSYHGWLGVSSLPELKKVDAPEERREGQIFEGYLHPQVKAHIFQVTRRWLDPNGDGDPSDGVDGFRLDVAPHVPLGFWRDFRKLVRSLNEDALLLGEAWWEEWPDKLMDPRPFLQGDIFDSVMHYQWYQPARQFFAQAQGGMLPGRFLEKMTHVYRGYDQATAQALMNLTASHDSPRLATSLANKQPYKTKMGARDHPALHIDPPGETTRQEMRLLLLHQFTYLSAPHLWAGEEMGMWGADDPDCRKPLLWQDIDHQPQSFRPEGSRTLPPLPVEADSQLQAYYRDLIALRRSRPELVEGSLVTVGDDNRMILAYVRGKDSGRTLAIFNRSSVRQRFPLPADLVEALRVGGKAVTKLEVLLETRPDVVEVMGSDPTEIVLALEPLAGAALCPAQP